MVDTQGSDPELIPAEQRKRKKDLQNPRLKQEANNPMIRDRKAMGKRRRKEWEFDTNKFRRWRREPKQRPTPEAIMNTTTKLRNESRQIYKDKIGLIFYYQLQVSCSQLSRCWAHYLRDYLYYI